MSDNEQKIQELKYRKWCYRGEIFEEIRVSLGNTENVSHVLILRMTTDFIEYEARYASRYVARKVYEAMKNVAKKAMYQFVRSSKAFSYLGSIRGTLYEHISHDLLKDGDVYQIMKIPGKRN